MHPVPRTRVAGDTPGSFGTKEQGVDQGHGDPQGFREGNGEQGGDANHPAEQEGIESWSDVPGSEKES